MSRTPPGRTAVLFLILVSGCGVVGPRRDSTSRGPKVKPSTEMAAGPKASREAPLADPSTMIPPPPDMNDLVPGIPTAPPKEELVIADGIVSPEAGVKVRPPVERARGQ